MTTTAARMSVDEFLVYAATHGRCELIDGEVVIKSPAGGRHGGIAARLLIVLGRSVQSDAQGRLFAAETGYVLNTEPPRVRAPDVSFVRAEHVAQARLPGFIRVAPDLVVEVLSPDDRATDVNAKVLDWLGFGVRVVWVVDPETRTILAQLPDGQGRTYTEADELPGDPAIPGLRLSVREIFA